MYKSKPVISKSSELKLEALEGHNDFWREHRSPPLFLRNETSTDSQKCAEDISKKESCLSDIASELVNRFQSSVIFDVKFDEEFLNAHNEYRKNHGAKPLKLNKILCKLAKDWAKTLMKKGKPEHRAQNIYGENIFSLCSSDPDFKVTGRDPVKRWYKEVAKHKFGEEPEDVSTCGHFTQVVWEDTREVGVGVARSEEGDIYVVAYYYPRGNVYGSFASKVKPPINTETSEHSQQCAKDLAKKAACLSDIDSELVHRSRSPLIFDDFDEEFLNAHNEYRKNHGVKPLKLNKILCKLAEDWAKTIMKKGKPEHRAQNFYGENIFSLCSSDPDFKVTGRDPVKRWYKEVAKHKFGEEPEDVSTCGHFTQVVWEDTREVGVGVARSEEGDIYVVAYYYPRGNVYGSFASKVKPPINRTFDHHN